MALAVNSRFPSRPSYYTEENQPDGDTRPFSYHNRPGNPRVPAVIRDQPCVDSDIYFSSPNVPGYGDERPPPRPPRSPKFSRVAPSKPPRTPPRSPLAGRAHLAYTQSDSDLHSHVGLRVPGQPRTPPPLTPPHGFGSKQHFFPSDERPPRSPRIPPRSFHPPDETPAVPPRSPRLPPKPMKFSQLPPPAPQPLAGRSILNRSDRSERAISHDPRTDVKKMTRQTSADTVRIAAQTERELLRSAPPPPKPTPPILEQPKSSRIPTNEVQNGGKGGKGPKSNKNNAGDREAFQMEKPKEKKGCCHQCAKICVNDISEFLIELCLD
ncbi:uncharacterized protein LOC129281288 [Lytechinus pictus]|uniref:uncharacterized protein LOC129281288 n=1 Tax=Lytechinus pictus TaxID=7653 RepID=UPI0030B9B4A0